MNDKPDTSTIPDEMRTLTVVVRVGDPPRTLSLRYAPLQPIYLYPAAIGEKEATNA